MKWSTYEAKLTNWSVNFSIDADDLVFHGKIWKDSRNGRMPRLRLDDVVVWGVGLQFPGGPDSYEVLSVDMDVKNAMGWPTEEQRTAIEVAVDRIFGRIRPMLVEFDPKEDEVPEGWDAIECGPRYNLPSSAPDAPHLGMVIRDGKIDVSDCDDDEVVVPGDRDFMAIVVRNGATVVDLDHDADKHMPPGWSFLLDDSGCYTGWNGYDGDIRWAVVEYDPWSRRVDEIVENYNERVDKLLEDSLAASKAAEERILKEAEENWF